MFEYKAKVMNVVDGDTYDVETDLGFNVKMYMRIRLNGVDTPETWRPKSEAEAIHGQEAKDFVTQAFAAYNNEIVIRTFKAGASIYGRYTANVLLGEDKHSLAAMIISNDLEKRSAY
jgi:micrococcal nuclease